MFQNFQLEGDLPTIKYLNYTKIQQNYFRVILLNFLVFFIVIMGGLSYLLFTTEDPFLSTIKWGCIIGVFIVFLLVLLGLVLGFSKRKYAVREQDISYRNGVLWTRVITVPFCRIQHVSLNEGPISRFFNLAGIRIYTAGDSSSDLNINGLKKEEAMRIKEFITDHINGK